MTCKVVFLPAAEQDLKTLRAYVFKHFGKSTWLASYSKIKASVEVIQTFPESGQIPEELTRLNLAQYRQIISGMNRIIYEVRQGTAYIHLVCDTRQDLSTLLTRRLLSGA